MAGDWIKMRGNLWDDPRVARLCDLTESSEAPVIGGLYWLWATADQHTETGVLPGLTLRQIDRKTGVKGLGEALVAIGWIADNIDGVCIVRFEEHNGASAKKRCQTAKRVAMHRSGNSDVTPGELQTDQPSVTEPTGNAGVTQAALQNEHTSVSGALAREEKRREEREKEEDKGESVAKRAAPRPTRKAPASFVLTDEMREWAVEHAPAVDVDLTTEEFRDYTFKTAKTDWPATWRNWMRKKQEFHDARPQARRTYGGTAYVPTHLKGQAIADRNQQVIDNVILED
jgi:hypothetical protein